MVLLAEKRNDKWVNRFYCDFFVLLQSQMCFLLVSTWFLAFSLIFLEEEMRMKGWSINFLFLRTEEKGKKFFGFFFSFLLYIFFSYLLYFLPAYNLKYIPIYILFLKIYPENISWKYNLYYMLLHQEIGIYGYKLGISILQVYITSTVLPTP